MFFVFSSYFLTALSRIEMKISGSNPSLGLSSVYRVRKYRPLVRVRLCWSMFVQSEYFPAKTYFFRMLNKGYRSMELDALLKNTTVQMGYIFVFNLMISNARLWTERE